MASVPINKNLFDPTGNLDSNTMKFLRKEGLLFDAPSFDSGEKLVGTSSGFTLPSEIANEVPEYKPYVAPKLNVMGEVGAGFKSLGGHIASGLVNMIKTAYAGEQYSAADQLNIQKSPGVIAYNQTPSTTGTNYTNIQQQQINAPAQAEYDAKMKQALSTPDKPYYEYDLFKTLDKVEKGINKAVDAPGSIGSQVGAMAGTSLSQIGATALGPVGGALIYKQSYYNAMDDMRAQGIDTNSKEAKDNAQANGLIDATISYLFEAVGVAGKVGKKAAQTTGVADVAKNVFKDLFKGAFKKAGKETAEDALVAGRATVGQVLKYLGKKSLEEGTEELLQSVGYGIAAKNTIRPNDPLFTWTNAGKGTMTGEDLLYNFAAGFLMGGAFSTVAASGKLFKNFNSSFDAMKDTKINDPDLPKKMDDAMNSLKEDMKDPANAQFVANEVRKGADKMATEGGDFITINNQDGMFRASKPNADGMVLIVSIDGNKRLVMDSNDYNALLGKGDAKLVAQREKGKAVLKEKPIETKPIATTKTNQEIPKTKVNKTKQIAKELAMNEADARANGIAIPKKNLTTQKKATPAEVVAPVVEQKSNKVIPVEQIAPVVKEKNPEPVKTERVVFGNNRSKNVTITKIDDKNHLFVEDVRANGYNAVPDNAVVGAKDEYKKGDLLFVNYGSPVVVVEKSFNNDYAVITTHGYESFGKDALDAMADNSKNEGVINLVDEYNYQRGASLFGTKISDKYMTKKQREAYSKKITDQLKQPEPTKTKLISEAKPVVPAPKVAPSVAKPVVSKPVVEKKSPTKASEIREKAKTIPASKVDQKILEEKFANNLDEVDGTIEVYIDKNFSASDIKRLEEYGFKHDVLEPGEKVGDGTTYYINSKSMSKKQALDLLDSMSFAKKQVDLLASEKPAGPTQGIVAPAFAQTMNQPSAKVVVPKYTTGNNNVDERINEAMSFKTKTNTMKDHLKSAWEGVKFFATGSIRLGYEKGDLRSAINTSRSSSNAAMSKVEQLLTKVYSNLNPEQYNLAGRYILFADLKRDYDKGITKGKVLPFEIPNEQFILDQYDKWKKEINKPENSFIKQAVEERTKQMEGLRDNTISAAKEIGMDLSWMKREDYYPHIIKDYLEERSSGQKKKGRTIGYKGREGSSKSYITDPATADAIIAKKLIADIDRFRVLKETKKFDIYPSLVKQGKADTIPDGYGELRYSDLNLNYSDTVQSAARQSLVVGKLQAKGMNMNSPQAKRSIRAAKNKSNDVMILPLEVRDAILEEYKSTKTKDTLIAINKVTSLWKVNTLLSPFRIIKSQIRNAYGDIEGVVTTHPSAFLKVPKAISELYSVYKKGVATKDMNEYIGLGGLSTSLTEVELNEMENFFKFYGGQKKKGFNPVKEYFKKAKSTSEFREQILRYAMFLDRKDELTNPNNTTGLPKFYGASVPAEIKSISDPIARAFRMAQDSLIDYNNTSQLGTILSKTIWPFYRFQEGNMRRNFRIIKNTFYNDPELQLSYGNKVLNTIGNLGKASVATTLKVGQVALGYMLLRMLLGLWNETIMGDSEKMLPQSVKDSVHITFGYSSRTGNVHYLGDASAISQFFDNLGIGGNWPVYSDAMDIMTGKKTLKDKATEIASSIPNAFISGLTPIIKVPIEIGYGKSMYPSPEKGTPIRNAGEYATESLTGLGWLYRAVTGKPQLKGNTAVGVLSKSLANSVSAGDAAVWDTYAMRDDYLKSIGVDPKQYSINRDPKAMPIYYYKQSLKLGDNSAATEYLKKYIQYGGTLKTYYASMKALDPLYSMKKDQKFAFLDQMTPEDKARYQQAMDYIGDLNDIGQEYKDLFTTNSK